MAAAPAVLAVASRPRPRAVMSCRWNSARAAEGGKRSTPGVERCVTSVFPHRATGVVVADGAGELAEDARVGGDQAEFTVFGQRRAGEILRTHKRLRRASAVVGHYRLGGHVETGGGVGVGRYVCAGFYQGVEFAFVVVVVIGHG